MRLPHGVSGKLSFYTGSLRESMKYEGIYAVSCSEVECCSYHIEVLQHAVLWKENRFSKPSAGVESI